MNGMKQHLRRLMLVAIGSMIALLSASDAQAARKLYVFLAADSADPTIGLHCKSDAENLHGLFGLHVVERELKVIPIPAERLTTAGITAAIRSQPIRAEDAVLFYYSGHGAHDQTGTHYFTTTAAQNDWIGRPAVIQALQQKGAALTVLLTDACFNLREAPFNAEPGGAANEETSPLFRRLFFDADGFVDVNACIAGQQAGTRLSAVEGSIFTYALRETLDKYAGVDTHDWKSILKLVAVETDKGFRQLFPDGISVQTSEGQTHQRTQTVAELTLNVSYHRRSAGTSAIVFETTVQIDPVSGLATMTSTPRWEPPSQQEIPSDYFSPPYVDHAQLLQTSDGTKYWYFQTYWALARDAGTGGGTADMFSAQQRFGAVVQTSTGGVSVVSLLPNGAAGMLEHADGNSWRLEPGDVIYQISGQKVLSLEDFARAMATSSGRVPLRVWGANDGRYFDFVIDVGPQVQQATQKLRFGAWVQSDGNPGVVVTQVVPNTPATRMFDANLTIWTIEPGDRIVSINDQAVNSPSEYQQAILASGQAMILQIEGSDGRQYRVATLLNE